MAITSTQAFVPIDEVRDGILKLKNGEYRAVLITSSINLSLKSEDEQTAIIMQFQNLLNSLEFPVQIFIQSRRLNIEPYLGILQEREKEIKEDLLKIQIREYMEFISKFTNESNIMTKHFFIVVPYFTPTVTISNDFSSILPFGASENAQKTETTFELARTQLAQRVSVVTQGLARFGVRAAQLSTEDVVELFYKEFNPGENNQPKINA